MRDDTPCALSCEPCRPHHNLKTKKKEEGKTKRSILFNVKRVFHKKWRHCYCAAGLSKVVGIESVACITMYDLALVIIWSDEPSRHAAASGSVDGAVSITRAAGA